MIKNVYSVLILFFLSGVIFAADISQADIDRTLDRHDLTPVEKGGFLYKVTKENGKYFYLFGVEHAPYAEQGILPIKMRAIKTFSESDYYVDESDYLDFNDAKISVMAKNSRPYISKLPESEKIFLVISMGVTVPDIREKIKKSGWSTLSDQEREKKLSDFYAYADGYLPIFWVWNSPDFRCKKEKNGGRNISIEKTFRSLADEFGIKKYTLQDNFSHAYTILHDLTFDEQVSALMASLKLRTTPSNHCGEYIAEEDSKNAEEFQMEMRDYPDPALRKFYQVWVSNRNIIFHEKIKEKTNGDGIGFFVVGAAHLFFNDGLISLLKSDGYMVDLLQ